MSNFGELKEKINEWSADDEDILLRKLKEFTDNYINKCEELGNNLESINKYVSLVNVDYFNSLNTLKNVSIKKFVEHVVDNDTGIRTIKDTNEAQNKISQNQSKTNLLILSKEEREANLLNKFKSAISKSLENLNIKSMIDIRVDQEKESMIDDDNVSVSSSKYFANHMNRGYKNMKLPFIIGTQEFFRHEYLGVYQGDSIISDNASNVVNNDNLNFERRGTTVEINLDELNTKSKLIEGNIPSIPNIPNIPTITAVPVPKSNVPSVPVPNPKIPVPPVIPAIPIKNNGNLNNKPNIPSIPNIPNIQENKKENEPIVNNKNDDIADKQENNQNSFKDTLNKMFSTNTNIGRPSNLNMNPVTNIVTPNNNLSNQQQTYTKENNLQGDHSKHIKIESIIRRPTIFDNVMDDDDDDDNSLFKRGIDRRQYNKSNLFDNVIPQTNNTDTGVTNTNISANILKNNNDQPIISQQSNQRETLQSFVRESNASSSTQLNQINIKPYFNNGSSTNPTNLIDNKNKNLEKAKSNLLKIFDDDEDEDKDINTLISTKINEKTVDLNNKLNLILDPKKDTNQNKNQEIYYNVNMNSNVKPYDKLVQDVKTEIKSDKNTGQNNLNNTIATGRPNIKRPTIFLEDDEDDNNIYKPSNKEDKQNSNKSVLKSDPLSTLLNNSSSMKEAEKKYEKKEDKSNLSNPIIFKEKDDIADMLKEVDFGIKKEEKNDINLNSEVIKPKLLIQKDKYTADKNESILKIPKPKISFDDEEEDIFKMKPKDTLKESSTTKEKKKIEKPNFDFEEDEADSFKKTLQKEVRPDEKENNDKLNPPSLTVSIIKPEKSTKIDKTNIESQNNRFDTEDTIIMKEKEGQERTDTSIKNNGIKIANRFSNIQSMLGEKLNFNSMMRPSAIDESGAISRVSKETHNNSIRQEDNEEKNYEKIVSEKTAVVNKKKPKMRVFNSNINKNSVVEEKIKSVEVNNKENCPFDEEIKEDGIKETKKEVKVEIKEQVKEKIPVESQKITVKNNFINTYDDPGVKNTEDNFNFNPKVEKSKFNFDSIIDKDEDNPQDLNVDLSNQTKNQNSSSKTPSTLFNFDDSSVIDNPTKNSLISNKNKFGDNSNLANKKPIDKKIKFLFEDE